MRYLTVISQYFSLVAIFFVVSSVSAQDFEVAPVKVSFNATPGESQSRTVTIKNHGNRRETITLRMQDYLVQREGKTELLPPGSTRNSIASWINLNPSFIELEPNESRTIQVNLQAPNDDFSSRWGILSFVTTAEQTVFSADRELQTGLAMASRIDIMLSYNPANSEPGRIEINSMHEVNSDNPDERIFSVNIDNLSERIATAKVFLIASNLQTAQEKRYRTMEVITYPQTTRTVMLAIPNDLPAGRYSLAAILDYPGSASLKGTQITIDVE